jgi:hypothetical protein
MTRSWLASALALAIASTSVVGGQDDVARTLKTQTQELFDAVTAGTPKVWDNYLDPDVVYLSEEGTRKSKADLLKEITPLPKGISGSIVVSDFQVRLHRDTAITTHNDLETENYFGHPLNAEYRSTDTWIRSARGWKLVASQVHAQLIDPPAIQLPEARLNDYTGVYRLTPDITYTIRRDGNALTGERNSRPIQRLSVETADVMFVPGQPRSRKIFLRSSQGRVTGFVDRREGRDLPWTRVD